MILQLRVLFVEVGVLPHDIRNLLLTFRRSLNALAVSCDFRFDIFLFILTDLKFRFHFLDLRSQAPEDRIWNCLGFRIILLLLLVQFFKTFGRNLRLQPAEFRLCRLYFGMFRRIFGCQLFVFGLLLPVLFDQHAGGAFFRRDCHWRHLHRKHRRRL